MMFQLFVCQMFIDYNICIARNIHPKKNQPPILMINGLQLLHILMMFNIGQFIFFWRKFSIVSAYILMIPMIPIQQHI